MYGNFGRNQRRDDEDDFNEDEELQAPAQVSKEWLADDALEALNIERSVRPDETHEQLSRRLLKENVPMATMSVINLALHGTNERLRLDAAKYVMDRVLGKPGEDVFDKDRSPLEELIDEVTTYVHSHA